MTPERWRQIRSAYEKAEGLEWGEREAFLESFCVGDAELREEVESLLCAAAGAGSVFLTAGAP